MATACVMPGATSVWTEEEIGLFLPGFIRTRGFSATGSEWTHALPLCLAYSSFMGDMLKALLLASLTAREAVMTETAELVGLKLLLSSTLHRLR